MRRISGEQFRNDAEAIEIGRDTGKSDERAISSLEVEAVCEDASGKKVSDWTHAVWPVWLLDFNQHVAVFNLQRIHSDLHAGILFGGAGFGVPSPAVPGADNFAAFDHPLAQRAAAVQADVVHGAISAVHICDADGSCAAGKFLGFVAGWQFGFGGELDEVRRHEDRLYRKKSAPTV